MQYKSLGSSGLLVSRVIFGGAHIGELLDQEQTTDLVHAGWDAGISTFYTADDYNNGRAEEFLGKALRPRREDVVIIVKTGYRVGTTERPVSLGEHLATHGNGRVDHTKLWSKGVPPTSRGLNRKYLTAALDRSLRRLDTEYIDVYAPHFWDPWTPIEETLGVLTDFVRAGKVRYLSCSQTSPWQLYAALWSSDAHKLQRYEAVQIRMNLLERDVYNDYAPAASHVGVDLLAFNPLAGGMLSGQFTVASDRPRGLGYRQQYLEMYWNDVTFDFLEAMRGIAREHSCTVSELALAWTLSQPAIGAILIGPNSADELAEQAQSATHVISLEESEALRSLLKDSPQNFNKAGNTPAPVFL